MCPPLPFRWRSLARAVALALAVVAAGCSDDGEGGDGGETRCRELDGDFPQPEQRCSSGGRLDTSLTAKIATRPAPASNSPATQTLPAEFTGPTFEGAPLGPTLRLEPGDALSIRFANDLPANPESQRCQGTAAEPEGCPFPHDPHTTNLHTHGLSVSPLDEGDNVLRRFEPGGRYDVRIDIPADHPSGTFWYHPHKHGSVSYQFFAGMAGFLIVDGGEGTLDAVPEVAAAKDVLLGFQLLRASGGRVQFVNPRADTFSGVGAGATQNGNCTNAPSLRCSDAYGRGDETCSTHSDCDNHDRCVGIDGPTEQACSQLDIANGSPDPCGNDVLGRPTACGAWCWGETCTRDSDCDSAAGAGDGQCGKWCNVSAAAFESPETLVPCTANPSCDSEPGKGDGSCEGYNPGCVNCGI